MENLTNSLPLSSKRKLRQFDHVSRSFGDKDHPTGHSEWQKKKGRQEKMWEHNIKGWTGMDSASSTRADENRTRRKGIVAKSSVVTLVLIIMTLRYFLLCYT